MECQTAPVNLIEITFILPFVAAYNFHININLYRNILILPISLKMDGKNITFCIFYCFLLIYRSAKSINTNVLYSMLQMYGNVTAPRCITFFSFPNQPFQALATLSRNQASIPLRHCFTSLALSIAVGPTSLCSSAGRVKVSGSQDSWEASKVLPSLSV